MDRFFLPLAEFLEDFSNSLRSASDDGFAQVQIAIMLFGAAMVAIAGVRQILSWVRGSGTKMREDMRAAQARCKTAQDDLKEAEERIDELRRYDPQVYLADRHAAAAQDRPDIARAFLEPLKPALVTSYSDIAEAYLVDATTETELGQARFALQGAFAADRDAPAAVAVREAVDQMFDLLLSQDLPDEMKAVLAIARRAGDVSALRRVAQELYKRGAYAAAQVLAERAYEAASANLGQRNSETLAAFSIWAECASKRAKYRRILDRAQAFANMRADEFSPTQVVEYYRIISVVVETLSHVGQEKEALELLDRTQREYDASPSVQLPFWANEFVQLQGFLQGMLGQYEAAIASYEVYLNSPQMETLSVDHIQYVEGAKSFFEVLSGRSEAVERLAEISENYDASPSFGAQHPASETIAQWYGGALLLERDFTAAQRVFERNLEFYQAHDSFGPESRDLVFSKIRLALCRAELGSHKEALSLIESVLRHWSTKDELRSILPEGTRWGVMHLVRVLELTAPPERTKIALSLLRDQLGTKYAPEYPPLKFLHACEARMGVATATDGPDGPVGVDPQTVGA